MTTWQYPRVAVLLTATVVCAAMLGCGKGPAGPSESAEQGPREQGHEGHAHNEHEGEGEPGKKGADVAHEEHEGHDEHGDEKGGEAAHDEHGDGDHDEHSDGDEDEHGEGGHAGHDEEEEEGRVVLSDDALKRSGVVIGTASSGQLAGSLEIPAEVHLNPDRVAHISPMVEGQIVDVRAALGDHIAESQPLIKLRSVSLGRARADLSRALALKRLADKNFARQARLRDEGISSERAYLEAQLVVEEAAAERDNARSRLRVFGVGPSGGPDMLLTSPIAGTIIERHATKGESVESDTTLFVIADLSRVWVIGRVYERQISQIKPGLVATLALTAYPGRSWSGKIDYVSSTLDEETRTLAVRIEIENPDGALRPGLFGALRLSGAERAASAATHVPDGAVQMLRGRSVVFVPRDGGFDAVEVTPGRSHGGQVEIVSGLLPDSKLVVKGAFVLKSELVRSQLGHGHAH